MDNTADINYFNEPLAGKTAEEAFKNRLPSILESHEENINNVISDLDTPITGVKARVTTLENNKLEKGSYLGTAQDLEILDETLNFEQFLQEKKYMYIIGDSITEGSKTTDFNFCYANLIKKAFLKKYNSNDFGFQNARANLKSVYGIIQYAEITTTGTWDNSFDNSVFGSVALKSSTIGSSIFIKAKFLRLFPYWQGGVGRGVLEVYKEGVKLGEIDTSFGTTSWEAVAPVDFIDESEKIIELRKKDSNLTVITGFDFRGFRDNLVVQNVGRSSLKLTDLPNDVLGKYIENGTVILSLGVNDWLGNVNLTTFADKLENTLSSLSSINARIVITDFIFKESVEQNEYKKIIKQKAIKYKENCIYIDFNKEMGGYPNCLNRKLLDTDEVHPTQEGHYFIADAILKRILPSKNSKNLSKTYGEYYTVKTLLNGFSNINSQYYEDFFANVYDNKIYIQGLIKNSNTLPSTPTVIAQLGNLNLKNSRYFNPIVSDETLVNTRICSGYISKNGELAVIPLQSVPTSQFFVINSIFEIE